MNDHVDITKATAAPVSRRKFITIAVAGSAALPAMAPAEVSGKTDRVPLLEDPWVKARRLADQLSEALVDVGEAKWFAKVYPKTDARGYSVMFGDIQSEREAPLRVETALRSLLRAHKTAFAALLMALKKTDDVALGCMPTKAEMRRWSRAEKVEQDALNAILNYVPYNDASRYKKVMYLLPFIRHEQLTDSQARTLLRSMCGRCA